MTINILIGVITLAITIYGSIIGVYVLIIRHMKSTSNSLGEIYKLVNSHIQEQSIHRDEKNFASAAVFVEVQRLQEKLLNQLDKKVDKLDTKMDSLSNDIKELSSRL